MLHHHSFPQTLPSRRSLVVGPGLLLQGFFGLDADRARPLPTCQWRLETGPFGRTKWGHMDGCGMNRINQKQEFQN